MNGSIADGDWLRLVAHGLGEAVRLWWVDLDAYARVVPLDGLRPEELERAGRMAFAVDARRWLAARHVLYRQLAAELGCAPAELELLVDDFGKPALVGGGPHFNLSHSGAEALIGVCGRSAIGVDIEVLRPLPDAATLARDHFSEAERAYVHAGAGPARDQRFLECWTAKEACVKALGLGLTMSLVEVSVGAADGVRAIAVPVAAGRAELLLCSVRPSDAAVGAVALATSSPRTSNT